MSRQDRTGQDRTGRDRVSPCGEGILQVQILPRTHGPIILSRPPYPIPTHVPVATPNISWSGLRRQIRMNNRKRTRREYQVQDARACQTGWSSLYAASLARSRCFYILETLYIPGSTFCHRHHSEEDSIILDTFLYLQQQIAYSPRGPSSS